MKFERDESKIIEKIMIDKMHEKAYSVLMENIICPEDFADLYGAENVKQDIEYVKKMENIFKNESLPETKEMKKLATTLEAIIYEQAELNNWLGPDAETIKTSQYDDIKNKVDSVVEFYKEEDYTSSHLALAIDETFSFNINEKFNRIKKEIEKGELTQIKYFVSEKMNLRGELNKLPRVVIGTNAKTIQIIGELWLEKKQKELAKHPIQFLLLEEMLLQIKTFKDYAQKIGQADIVAIYDKTEKILQKIYNEKKDEGLENARQFIEDDKVYDAIINGLMIFH